MTTERYELAEGYMEFAPEDGKWVHWSDYSKMRSAHLAEVHSLKSRIAELEKDAARYALSKKYYDIRISRYKGKYRADNGSRVLTGWMDSYDECFDTAMKGA